MRNWLPVFIFIIALINNPINAVSQDLVDSEFLGSFNKLFIEIQFGQEVENGVDLYKLLYTTIDLEGAIDTASGLVAIPDNNTENLPLVSYQHGTTNDPEDVPSRLNSGLEAIAYGAFGYLVAAADMLGRGDSRGFHPYLHADSQAWAAIDMLFAMRDFTSQNNLTINNQLFIAGYSQGGHAAMATHKSIQEDFAGEFTVTASTPMSGPYDVSGKMVEFTMGEEEYFFPSYLAFTLLSYQEAYGNLYSDLSEVIKPAYINEVIRFRNGEIDLSTLDAFIQMQLITDVGNVVPRHILQDSILAVILEGKDHPINDALKANDLYNWVPSAPMRMFYCKGDDQVTYKNSTFTDSVMNAMGADDVLAINLNDNFDHGECGPPAFMASIEFFNSFQFPLSTKQTALNQEQYRVFPNPASTFIHLELMDPEIDVHKLELYTLDGKKKANLTMPNSDITISTLSFSSGTYILKAITSHGAIAEKIVISK